MNDAVLAEWHAARRAVIDHVAIRVVGVTDERGRCRSGIVWDADFVVTAADALRGVDRVVVHTAGDRMDAVVIASDPSVDVAVLRARTGTPAAQAADPGVLSAGDPVILAGRQQGRPLIASGQVRLIGPAWRSRRGGELARLIRLDPGLDRELEGGGVFDAAGNLAAMAVPGPALRTLGIPAETIARVVSAVRVHGRLPHPYLGLRLQPIRLDEPLRHRLERPRGAAAIVVGVEPDSPAEAGGLRFGDVILQAGPDLVESAMDLHAALRRVAIGTPISLRLYRAGEVCELSATVRERPQR